MQAITSYFVQALAYLSTILGGFGWAIIAFTVITRLILLPIILPSLKAQRATQKKMKEMQPELKKLQQKYKNDKQALQQAQLALYQKYNVNPLSGCLPQLLQLGLLIILYQALMAFINGGVSNGSDLHFFWLDLGQKDPLYILPVLAALTQLFLSLMIAPGAEIPDIVPNKSKNKALKAANEKEENTAEMAAAMQQQMLFLMPIMTGFIALNFPSGLALYWVASTLFGIVQQYFVSGWGGLSSYYQRFRRKYAKN